MALSLLRWHIITGEYPPQRGGVSDYARLVARGLAEAGDEVEVWAPECHEVDEPVPNVRVHHLPGHFGSRALAMMDLGLGAANRHRLLVQYVPHAYGFKAMNLPFCYWLYARRHKLDITVMFHEVAFPRRKAQPLRHNFLGEVQALMAAMVARSARRIVVSTQAWETTLRPLIDKDVPIAWVPVPSNVPLVEDTGASEAVRVRYAGGGLLVGHFGTYGPGVTKYLETALPQLLEDDKVNVILLGRGGGVFRDTLVRRYPQIAARLHATNALTSGEISIHLSACDLMLQPYPDGISARRTSAMAALAHGRPVVTTAGQLTERLWTETDAVAAVSANDSSLLGPTSISLLQNFPQRERLGLAARTLYFERFDLRHTIDALRNTSADCNSQLVQP